MAYTPPIFNAVNADLKPTGSASVVVPNYNAVDADLAIDPTAAAAPPQTVLAPGIDSAAFGATSIRLQKQPINLDGEGFDLSDFGDAEIANLAFGVYPDGIEGGLTVFGYPEIQYGVQTVDLEWYGIPDGGASSHDIQNYYRYVLPYWSSPASDSSFGDTEVNYQGRFVSPIGVPPSPIGDASASLKNRFLNQIGWTSSVFGSHLVWDGVQTVPLLGWASSEAGSPIVSGLPPTGPTTQYLELSGKGVPVPDNSVWPPLSVANRNRQLFPDTFVSYAVPSPTVDQTIYLTLHPLGADWSVFGTPSVDQTVRVLGAAGWNSSYVSTNSMVSRYSRDVIAGGFRSSVWGDHNVYYGTQRPSPAPIAPSGGVGDVEVTFRVRYLSPPGLDATLFGTAIVQDAVLYARPGGIPPLNNLGPIGGWRIPSPTIDFRTKLVVVTNPPGAGGVSDQTTVTHFVQWVDLAGSGTDGANLPEPVVDFRYRTVFPTFVASLEWGTAFVHRTTFVSPTGWESSTVPENSELLINTRRVYYYTGEADPAKYGVATIFNWVQNINLDRNGWYDTQWSFPVVYNLKQEIVVAPFAENVNPDQWPKYLPLVENKNRVLGAFGHQSSRVSIAGWIHNAADPIYPVGTDMTLWGAGTFIAHRIRTVQGQGWDSFYNERYTVVWNKADVLGPAGVGNAGAFGTPNPVANLNREIKQHSGWSGPDWGVPFVAYRIRSVAPGLFYDVPAGYPEVRHNPFPIAPAGIPWQGQVGGHELRIFRREVLPYALNVHDPWFGEPIVRNRNVTVRPYGYDQSEYGRAKVENFIRYVSPEWFRSDEVPEHLISRRTRELVTLGIAYLAFTQLHRVRNDSPDPPGPQTIDLSRTNAAGEVVDGDGIQPPESNVNPSNPVIRLNTIYPIWDAPPVRFGTGRVWANALEAKFWQSDGEVGVPTLIFTQYVDAQSVDAALISSGVPSMSPFTIYAPLGEECPSGYTPDSPGMFVDAFLSSPDGSSSPWFGYATVTNQHREIGPVPYRFSTAQDDLNGHTKWGTAAFTLRRQYVYVDAIRSLRMGFPVLWGVPQFVNLDDPGANAGIPPYNAFGDTTVAFPVDPHAPQYVYPDEYDATLWGENLVELLDRVVEPEGIPHSGNPQQYETTPWGDALVGYPRRYTIGMGSQTLWGTHVIEYVNRQVWPEGWNSCTLESWDFENYKFPMKVIRKNPLVRPASMGDVTVFGTCTVSQRVRTVYSRGVDSYNSGSHSVKASSTIGAQGWESLLIGDIDRWEAGKIKAHGDDMSGVGTPRLLHPLRALGFDSGVVVAPRIAPALSPIGIPNIAFDGPSVTNPFGCTNRVVSPLPILSNQTVPLPVVA